MTHPLTTKKVVVIGAGAAGLVAARELRKEGHDVVVFERGGQLGGSWVYTDEVESDPLGLDPTRTIVQSSLYASLRTNSPREAMGFRDFPFVPTGIDLWPGRQIHSHNYPISEPYRDQVVVLIGLSASAIDISRDIAASAKEVHVTTRSKVIGKLIKFGKHPKYENMWLHPMIERAHEDGRISFQDGSVVLANVIIHCTGYKQHFPFLHNSDVVKVEDNRVGPLYKHVFPPALAPGISFVGLPSFVDPFFLFELQSKWIAGVLSGCLSLPSMEKMMENVEAFYSELDSKGVPKHYTHRIHDFKNLSGAYEYEDWLAAECGCSPAEEWRRGMFFATISRGFKHTETYRDEWDDENLVLQAYEDFTQYLSDEGKAAISALTL